MIILVFFGLTDKSQCSQYSERMERAFSSPSADREIKTKLSAYSRRQLRLDQFDRTMGSVSPWSSRKGISLTKGIN